MLAPVGTTHDCHPLDRLQYSVLRQHDGPCDFGAADALDEAGGGTGTRAHLVAQLALAPRQDLRRESRVPRPRASSRRRVHHRREASIRTGDLRPHHANG